MCKYIWQKKNWPRFSWNSDELLLPLGLARRQQGYLQADADNMGLKDQATLLTEETIKTAAIEGEKLNLEAVRSSVARRLGLATAGLSPIERHSDGLVEVLIDATTKHSMSLTSKRIKGWHAALFPTGYSGMAKITVADWRNGYDPMQVVSGRIGKERVHYEAPPSKQIDAEMRLFFKWWKNTSCENMDGLLRAAIAHFWFVSIHPFDDGNGRLARAITDMALAQDEGTGRRLYSFSAQIMDERKMYYNVLESAQKGDGDLTEWTIWFLKCFERTVIRSGQTVNKTVKISKFWEKFAKVGFNDRQRKVVSKLLEAEPSGFEGGLTNKKYVSMTKTSRETAKRDISDLVEKKIVLQNSGGGRSISYRINFS